MRVSTLRAGWSALLLFWLALATVSAQAGEHAEPEGLLLRRGSEVVVTVWEGVATGEIEVFHEMTTDEIAVSFLDADGAEFIPEVAEGFSLYTELVDPLAVEITQTGDWSFTLTGLLEGITGMSVGIFHEGHVDWLSPEIEVHVEEEHAEAEGLVVSLGGVPQVRVFEGVVEGGLVVGEGVVSGPYDVVFLDAAGDAFVPEVEEGFLLWAELLDAGPVSFDQVGDWSFTLEGWSDGGTELSLGIFHVDHVDYASPGIPVDVAAPASLDPLAGSGPALRLRAPEPNPVTDVARLGFDLTSEVRVDLEVFDTRGRQVATLLSEVRSAGTHAVEWVPGSVPSGIYFVRLGAANDAAVTRVVVSR